jgi:chitin synthase
MYILFRLVVNSYATKSNNSFVDFLVNLLQFIWIFALVVQVIVSLRNKPEEAKKIHLGCALVFGCGGIMMMVTVLVDLFGPGAIVASVGTKIMTALIFLSPVIAAVAHFEWTIILSMLQYYLMLPTYVNTFSLYSFCNTHDCSWGKNGNFCRIV